MNLQVRYILVVAAGGILIAAPNFFQPEGLIAFAEGWFTVSPVIFLMYLIFVFLVCMKGRKYRIKKKIS